MYGINLTHNLEGSLGSNIKGVFVNGTVVEWNCTIHGAHLICKKLFLKLIITLLLFT
jgi:hypothetical protein